MSYTYLINASNCWGKDDHLIGALENWVKEFTSSNRGEPAVDAKMEVIIFDCEQDKVTIGGMGFNFPSEVMTYSRLMDMPDYQYIRACGAAMQEVEHALADMSGNVQRLVDELETECGL